MSSIGEIFRFTSLELVIIAACCVLVPTFANASSASIIEDDSSDHDASVGSTPIEQRARILHIGHGSSDEQYSKGAVVAFDRAADLVGVPLSIISRNRISRGSSIGSGNLPSGSPLRTTAINSTFGMRTNPVTGLYRLHQGMDLAASSGTPVTATSSGVVRFANWKGGYGLLVSLDHGAGVQTRYGHLSRVAVSAGQQVQKGDIIGYVGTTGNSTGPHLHYEVRVNGQALNPARLLKRK